jgi:hypothetical protein
MAPPDLLRQMEADIRVVSLFPAQIIQGWTARSYPLRRIFLPDHTVQSFCGGFRECGVVNVHLQHIDTHMFRTRPYQLCGHPLEETLVRLRFEHGASRNVELGKPAVGDEDCRRAAASRQALGDEAADGNHFIMAGFDMGVDGIMNHIFPFQHLWRNRFKTAKQDEIGPAGNDHLRQSAAASGLHSIGARGKDPPE